jgi:hypothetical protein
MVLYATIGGKALSLLFLWLISGALASCLSDREACGELVGLTFGLLVSILGLAVVLLLPGASALALKLDGPLPRRAGAAEQTRRSGALSWRFCHARLPFG